MKKGLLLLTIPLLVITAIHSSNATINFHTEIYDLEKEIAWLEGRKKLAP